MDPPLVSMRAVVETLEEMEEARMEEEHHHRHQEQLLGLYRQSIIGRRQLNEEEKQHVERQLLHVNPLHLIPPGTLSEPRSPVVEQKLEILDLFASGLSHRQIATQLDISKNLVQYALASPAEGPALRSGLRPPALTRAQVEALIKFVTQGRAARLLSFANIPIRLHWDCTEASVSYTLKRAGYKKYLALVKPLINEEARQLRLAFAREHVHWTLAQWQNVLWCGMKLFGAQTPVKFFITRKEDEQYHPDCIVSKLPSPRGQIIWAAYSGLTGKGPGILWRDAWGPVNAASVSQHIVPRLAEWLDNQPGSVQVCVPHNDIDKDFDLMTAAALREVEGRQMSVLQLPPASPDLNPMAIVWDKMRKHVGYLRFADDDSEDSEDSADPDDDPNIKSLLTRNVQSAWDIMMEPMIHPFPKRVLRSMRLRCQAVIDADGMYTHF